MHTSFKWHLFYSVLLIFCSFFSTAAQDCTQDSRVTKAKQNMSASDSGLTCSNVAEFYAKLCQCETKPLTKAEASNLKKQLEAIKTSYNDYGVYCKDFGKITDYVPDCLVQSNQQGSGDDDLLKALTSLADNGNASSAVSGSADCNFAARDKFGSTSFSNSGAEHAANQYEGYRCHCINGTAQKQFDGSAFSVNQLKNLRQNYYNVKGPSDPGLSPLPSKCADSPRGGSSGGIGGPKPIARQNIGEIVTGNQLSRDLTDFMGSLASESSNPGIKALAEEMQQNSATIDQIRADASIFGPMDETTDQMLNMGENVMQAIAIGKAIFGVNKSKKPELTAAQKQLRSSMGSLSRKIRMIYDEVTAIPYYYEANQETLQELNKLEQRLLEYEYATASARLIYLEYIVFDGFPTQTEMARIKSIINTMPIEQVLERIENIQNQYNTDDMPHMANASEGLAGTFDKINMYKARCYAALGMKDKAEQIRKNLTYNVAINDAIKLTQESFKNKDYYSTAQYASLVQDHFQNETVVRTIYSDLISLTYNFDGIRRFEIGYLAALGVIANIKTNQITQADQALKGLKRMHTTFEETYEYYRDEVSKRKKMNLSDEEFRLEVLRSKAMLNVANAHLAAKKGNPQEALSLIIEAKKLYDEAPELAIQKFDAWFLYQKLEILMTLQKFEEAKDVIRDLKQNHAINAIAGVTNYDSNNLGYFNAYIRFKKEDYKGALFALKILKKQQPTNPKIYALEEEIYKALDNTNLAEKSHQKYLETLQKL